MNHIGLLLVLLLALLGACFSTLVIVTARNAQPLNEVAVTVSKKPVFTFHQLYCNHKYGDVTQAGPHLKCLRTDI